MTLQFDFVPVHPDVANGVVCMCRHSYATHPAHSPRRPHAAHLSCSTAAHRWLLPHRHPTPPERLFEPSAPAKHEADASHSTALMNKKHAGHPASSLQLAPPHPTARAPVNPHLNGWQPMHVPPREPLHASSAPAAHKAHVSQWSSLNQRATVQHCRTRSKFSAWQTATPRHATTAPFKPI